MPEDLRDRVALVTGGGRGIGKTIAEGLAAAGAKVAITGRSAPHLAETVAAIEKAGGRAIALPGDVTEEPRVQQWVAETQRHLGPIDILVSNAAIEGPLGPMWEVSTAEWRRCLEVNLMGPFIVNHAVLPGMVARRSGRIINVGSGGGLFAVPYDTGYSTTKAALTRLTEGIAIEAEEFGVYTWVIHPGVVHTNMSDTVMGSAAGQKWLPGYPEALRRGATPVEWASELTNFLASGAADGLTGCFLSVNDNYRGLAARAAEIKATDMYMLRLRTTPGPGPARRAFQ
jgi:3-oxoacyl-[acyl-carrier protein] reductase